ncbi:MAG: hypothetical protein HQL46_04525 [Gammaproteobacteria bacterium]|nr:hypothetical protein [Gammaproteobacteria bacterium]
MSKLILFTALSLLIAVNADAVEYQATIKYENTLKLNSPVTGVILEVAKEGKYYSSGSTLIKFDNQIINNKVNLNKKQLKLAQLKLAEQQKEMDRAQELYDANNLADYDLKKTQMNLLQSQVDLQQISNMLIQNQWQQNFYQLNAPKNGFLVAAEVYQGEFINNKLTSKSLLNFVPDDKILAKVYLDKNNLTQLSLTSENKKISLIYQEQSIAGQLVAIHDHEKQIVLDIKLIKSDQLPVDKSLVKIRLNDTQDK